MNIASMEPMVPEEASRQLDDDILPLVAEANQLAGRIHPILREAIGDLVRSMNCYYSNLIEGHDTHPRDIDRALANDFSSEPKKRDLQKEAVAHIHVQRLIDSGRDPDVWPASAAYASWLHEEFCSRLPTGLRSFLAVGASAKCRLDATSRHRTMTSHATWRGSTLLMVLLRSARCARFRRWAPSIIAYCGYTLFSTVTAA